jgi:four helix bundle protein
MSYQGFKELKVWIEAKNLAVSVYRISERGMLSKDFGLKDQLRRASVSIASNIAEGYERNSDKEFIRFLYIAKGSLSELQTQFEICNEIGYMSNEEFKQLENQSIILGKMLTNLIKARSNNL